MTDMTAQLLTLLQTRPSNNFELFNHIFCDVFADIWNMCPDHLFVDIVWCHLLLILQECYIVGCVSYPQWSVSTLLCKKTSNNSTKCCTLMRAITSLQALWADGRGVGVCSRHHTDDEFLVGTKLHSARQDRASVQTRG